MEHATGFHPTGGCLFGRLKGLFFRLGLAVAGGARRDRPRAPQAAAPLGAARARRGRDRARWQAGVGRGAMRDR